MDKEQFDIYAKGRYEDQITWYNKKAISSQKKYKFWLQLSS